MIAFSTPCCDTSTLTTTNTSPTQTNSHRWAFIQCYEPDVDIGNPILSAGFTALTIS
jgi:hypothetical protein